jgi:predicted HicB family RNase H-like nuclease
MVTFYVSTLEEARANFKDQINDYHDACTKQGLEPLGG